MGTSPSHGEGPSTALLATMQGGFATLSGNMANTISEALKQVKADLEISSDMTEIQDEDILSCHARRIRKSVRKYG